MSSMMKKLSDQISGAKQARKDKRMKRQMAQSLGKLVREGKVKLKEPEKPEEPVEPAKLDEPSTEQR